MLALLQAAVSLLVSAQSSQATPAMMQNAINIGNHVVQTVVQANAKIDFVVPKNNSIWPNVNDLLNAPYLTAKGDWVRLSEIGSLAIEYTSFGDINNDGLDDAAVIVNRQGADGKPHYFLGAMLSQDNILFNIADFPLGDSIHISSHDILNGKIVIDGSQYELLGREIRKVL